MDLTQSIKRPSLHEELVERLRNLIVEDALKPDTKVPEKDLCEAFGVSRTPLREALKVLASEGLVELHANRGARVTRVTLEELENTFPVIAMLEQLAGELSCKNLSDAEIADIQKQHDAMVKAYISRDRTAYFHANQHIHNALIAGARNDILEAHHRMLAARVRRVRFMVNVSEDRWAEAIQEHEQMMEKLHERDGPALGELMKTHLMNKCAAHVKSMIEAAENVTEG
ncbi:MAG: GntR family transcriptional regulator [Pseudomonadota bacterium]